MRVFVVIFTSLAIASGVAWVGVQANNTPEPTPPRSVAATVVPVVPKEAYLFSNQTIELGASISADTLIPVKMEIDQAGKDLIADTPENRDALVKVATNRTIPASTPFVKADLLPIEEKPAKVAPEQIVTAIEPASPSGSLRPGMRAISLPMTGETAVAGLIGVQDKIDVMVSYNSSEGVRAVRTVLRNVRVIGTDQPAGQSNAALPRAITLELHPEGAKMLTLARHTGDLILVLNDQGNDDMPVIVDDAPMLSTQISGLPAQRAARHPRRPASASFAAVRAARIRSFQCRTPSRKTLLPLLQVQIRSFISSGPPCCHECCPHPPSF
ncbi:Flp pilus assembly protein CpaB [Pseudosulfitobacter pseudonitzschiae]|uniref:Flp pilus assembly protein CpaB n=2 Tax=Pseudosulfitobacter pseudonitzschiae TaxID=1402135 RepID=UPI001E375BD9|nr:Flp pilus assembly protein CpaB [Pseudosulfitobacter pseudonitzschiae]UFF04221.1 Flp pilus assembly protein CpaB [Pseudosulfitobacter pseudonitzschiae]